MKKLIFFFVTFLLLISLATAIDVTTNKKDYSSGEMVSITVTSCTGTPFVEIRNSASDLVDIKSGLTVIYNTASDSDDGKYKVTVTCSDGSEDAFFCVDDKGCTIISGGEAPPSKKGGGTYCSSQWACNSWSFCNANLQQSRTCTDLNNCQAPRTETQECSQCEESWICSLWSECYLSTNQRTCFDEHACGTSYLKPFEEKSCKIASPPGPAPAQVSTQLPPPTFAYQPPVPVPEKSALDQFWEDYKFHALAGSAGLILLIIIILLITHFVKARKSEAYNLQELKDWIQKERQIGASETEMKETLQKHTSWRPEEISKAFQKPNNA
ncbi:MAG: hypothetical protein ABIG52_03025 [Nanoarchaeota archaeon]|nr:hypothetical protein [Nanoarchaeota archaeon]MBU1643939.1 hypothetical protein [Nanoarchaeota archaeon]